MLKKDPSNVNAKHGLSVARAGKALKILPVNIVSLGKVF